MRPWRQRQVEINFSIVRPETVGGSGMISELGTSARRRVLMPAAAASKAKRMLITLATRMSR